METKPTLDQVKTVPLNDLVKLLPPEVKYTSQKKDELKSVLLSAVNEPAAKPVKAKPKTQAKLKLKPNVRPKESLKAKVKKSLQVMPGKEVGLIVRDKNLSKSEKLRRLYDGGITKITGLAELVSVHYSFAHGVIARYLKRK